MNEEKSQKEINQELHEALYGNPETGSLGVVQKTDEIYQILSAFKLFGKAVMWLALFMGSVGTAIAGYFQIAKHLLKK